MKKTIINYKIFLMTGIILALLSNTAFAYWLWTPETKKFVNPKYAVKDSPKEQFDWAMSFYNAKDYQRAVSEFEKLVKQYEYSEYAADSQYYAGLSYETMGKFYIAYQNYQKAIDNFPHIENLDEIIAREFNIANFYATKDNPKVLGMDIMMALDRAIEIYKKVVDNAPYGKLAEESQFKMGEALKKGERYDEAIQAFQKLAEDYPNSKFADKARYETAYCAYKASLKPAYDIEPTDKAIKAFQNFAESNQDKELSKEADKTVLRLRDKAAEKSMITARFYESQNHYQSAVIYYQEVLDKFPDCSFVKEARTKIDKLSAVIKNREDRAKGLPGEGPRSWNPIKFANKPKPKETTDQNQAPKAAKSSTWKPFSFANKPKPEKVAADQVREAKAKPSTWKPFSLASKPKPKKEPVQAVTTDNADQNTKVENAKVQKKGWAPFTLAGPAKKKETVEQAQAPKAVRASTWKPFSFANKPKPEKVATEQVRETKAEKPSTWKPFSFANKPKPEKVAAEQVQEPKAKPSTWKPFSFASKPKPKKEPVQSVTTDSADQDNKKKESAGQDQEPKAVRLNSWSPLNFSGKPKPGKTLVASQTEPLKTETAPVTEEPQATTAAQGAEAEKAPVVPEAGAGVEAAPASETTTEPATETVAIKDTSTAQDTGVANTDEPKKQEVR